MPRYNFRARGQTSVQLASLPSPPRYPKLSVAKKENQGRVRKFSAKRFENFWIPLIFFLVGTEGWRCFFEKHYVALSNLIFIVFLIVWCLSIKKAGDIFMSKHMTLSERKDIEMLLKEGKSFKEIGRSLGKDCTTISKEVRHRLIERKSGAWGQAYNACVLRFGCKKSLLCKKLECEIKKCATCKICNNFCDSFSEEVCKKLDKPPYVCNGCETLKKCTLRKKFYIAADAQEEYEYVLSESRTGIAINEDELSCLDQLLTPLIQKGQSIHHICVNNADSIMYSEKHYTTHRFGSKC